MHLKKISYKIIVCIQNGQMSVGIKWESENCTQHKVPVYRKICDNRIEKNTLMKGEIYCKILFKNVPRNSWSIYFVYTLSQWYYLVA